jgi:hypothetical protein
MACPEQTYSDFCNAAYDPGYSGEDNGPHVDTCGDWNNSSPCGDYYVDNGSCENKEDFVNWHDVHSEGSHNWDNYVPFDQYPFSQTPGYADQCHTHTEGLGAYVDHYEGFYNRPYNFAPPHYQQSYLEFPHQDFYPHQDICHFGDQATWNNYPHTQTNPHTQTPVHDNIPAKAHIHTRFINFCNHGNIYG